MGFTLRRPSFIKPPTLALDSHVDVLIIGADPAGLLAAIGLAREDFSIRIIDQRTNKTMIGGADRLVPRTLEVLKVRRNRRTLEGI
jgi:phenol 2-monooxygenase